MAITGSRGFRKGEEDFAHELIRKTLAHMGGVTEFRTGAQWGVDTVAATLGLSQYPNAHHVVYVPAAAHNDAIVREVENAPGAGIVASSDVQRLPKQKTDALAYRLRNLAMVEGSELVIAFPSTRVEEVRSGTWMTVRIARTRDIPLMVRPLDGTRGWVERGIAGEQRVEAEA